MAVIEYSSDDGTSWSEIDYHTFTIERGNGKNLLAPEVLIHTHKECPVDTDDIVRILINGTRVFEGFSNGSGVVQVDGGKRLTIRGYGYDVMEKKISLDLTSVSPETVLSNAISGTDYTLSTSTATGITLDYTCTDKKRKLVFADMIDRTGYVFRVTPDKTIYFEDVEDRGSWQSLTVGSDNIVVDEWNKSDADTIINKVVVNGTGGEGNHKASASDYSYTTREHSREYNFNYITTTTEAQAMANQLLQPTPLSNAIVIIAESGFTPSIYSDLVNYTINLTDSSKNISSEVLVVEKQIVTEGRIELHLGKGSSFSIHDYNREVKSSDEKNFAGVSTGTGNTVFFTTDHTSITGMTENDVALEDSDSDGEYEKIYYYDGSSWHYGATRSAIDATNNIDYYDTSLSNITGMTEGDIAVIDEDTDGDYDHIYVYDGSNWQSGGTISEINADVTKNHTSDINHAGGTAPSNPEVGWYWLDTNNSKLKRYNGSSWIVQVDLTGDNPQNFSWIVDDGDKPENGADVTKYHTNDIHHIGGTPPSSPQDAWYWLDTSLNPDTLKQYDSGTSSWEIIGTVEASWGGVVDDGNKPEDNADVTGDHPDDIIYYQSIAPSHKEGRLWFDKDIYKLYRSVLGVWQPVGDETLLHADDVCFIGSTSPSHQAGRLWYDTSTSVLKRSDGSSWSETSDKTSEHSNEIIWKGSTPPSHKDGRLWYDTDTSEFYRSDGSSWEKVSDITSVWETFSSESDIDVLQTTNAPAQAGADVTSDQFTNSIQEIDDSVNYKGVSGMNVNDWTDYPDNTSADCDKQLSIRIHKYDGNIVIGFLNASDSSNSVSYDIDVEVKSPTNHVFDSSTSDPYGAWSGTGDNISVDGDEIVHIDGTHASANDCYKIEMQDSLTKDDVVYLTINTYDDSNISSYRLTLGDRVLMNNFDKPFITYFSPVDSEDFDCLLLQNGPSEANADETINHSDDIIYRGSSAPSHKDGRLWYDTSVNKFKESRNNSWSVVGDETALHETFSAEGDIDVLQTTNAPSEASADVTGSHNCQNPGDYTSSNGQPDNWITGWGTSGSNHTNVVKGGTYNKLYPSLGTTYNNYTGNDLLVLCCVSAECDPGEEVHIQFRLDTTGEGLFVVHNSMQLLTYSSNSDTIKVRGLIGGIVPAGGAWKYYPMANLGITNLTNEHQTELRTQ